MTREESIIELGDWLLTPPGRCLLSWEQACLDRAVADLFGFHALQLGLPEMDALRTNRMPCRWVASEAMVVPPPIPMPPPEDEPASTLSGPLAVTLHCLPEALPFPDQSLDLVVMPHTLELARDAHQALAEVTRVLRPEGRLVLVGLNPASLWALRQTAGRLRQGLGLAGGALFLPRTGEFIGYWRLRDWLRLLSLDVEFARFGCYRPPFRSERWLLRAEWMETVGERWWPVLGSVYFVQAVKRVRGMRLVGLVPRPAPVSRTRPSTVANRDDLG
jgi:SAM-dependent methyltransferase